MEKIIVSVYWENKNYCCGWGNPQVGVICCTGATLEEAKTNFKSSLNFHLQGMKEDGDHIPKWIERGEYEIVFELAVSALLRECEQYTDLSAISRASGINVKQLSHYANNLIIPRKAQCDKIRNGIHELGQRLSAAANIS